MSALSRAYIPKCKETLFVVLMWSEPQKEMDLASADRAGPLSGLLWPLSQINMRENEMENR
jgi:hypothetical protein